MIARVPSSPENAMCTMWATLSFCRLCSVGLDYCVFLPYYLLKAYITVWNSVGKVIKIEAI